jgi:hypothetical protein
MQLMNRVFVFCIMLPVGLAAFLLAIAFSGARFGWDRGRIYK